MIDALLRGAGADVLLAARAENVRWLGGPSQPADAELVPWAAAPVALVRTGGDPVFVAPEAATGAVDPPAADELLLDRLRTELPGAGRIAVDGSRAAGIVARLGSPSVDLDRRLLEARAVKRPDEVEAIRRACLAASRGQRAVRAAALAGATELDLLAHAEAEIRAVAGEACPLICDLMAGTRTSLVGAPPGLAELGPGEPLLCDLAPRIDGWWGDSCATLIPANAPRELRDAHDRARRSLQAGAALLRPGALAADVYSGMLAELGTDPPHHLGHGLGASPHELPRIVAGGRDRIEAGMVVALEPGLYGPASGVRVEHVYAVSADGATPLTDHDL